MNDLKVSGRISFNVCCNDRQAMCLGRMEGFKLYLDSWVVLDGQIVPGSYSISLLIEVESELFPPHRCGFDYFCGDGTGGTHRTDVLSERWVKVSRRRFACDSVEAGGNIFWMDAKLPMVSGLALIAYLRTLPKWQATGGNVEFTQLWEEKLPERGARSAERGVKQGSGESSGRIQEWIERQLAAELERWGR